MNHRRKMHLTRTTLIAFTSAWILTGCTQMSAPPHPAWQDQLNANLSVLGARNWVVIAESSYPSYTGSGVTTMTTDQTSPEIFLQVLNSLESAGYVQPRIMVCSELKNVDEAYAPGVKKYRYQLNKLLPGRMHFELPSRIINGQIEAATRQYKVLVIKTSTALPYSNIYIELDSGYWNSESETALRSKIEGAGKPRTQTPPGEETPATPIPRPPANNIATPPATPSTDNLPTLPRETSPVTDPPPSSPSLMPVEIAAL